MTAEQPAQPGAEIENLMGEGLSFPPSPEFVAQANATADLYAAAEADFEGFWADLARERLDWTEPFHTTLEWDLPFAKWFVGGKLNVERELRRPPCPQRPGGQGRLPLDR